MNDLELLIKMEEEIDERIFLVTDEEFEKRNNDVCKYVLDESGNILKLSLMNIRFNNVLYYLKQLNCLLSLDLSFNKLSSLPPEILSLTNLQSLDLSANQLSSFPPEIGALTNLQSLDLSANQLSSFPSEICSLTNLQSLDLGGNQLSSLPSEILSLTNLQSLYLRNNQLSSLPPEIGALTNLQSLYLISNQLSSLPPEIGALTNLQSLDLSDNQLSSFPPEILSLTNLQSLDLRGNQLSSLPPEIGALTNLQSLVLSFNKFSSLPSEIGTLTNLQSLYLSSNQFSSFPFEIFSLTNLQSLDLGFNKFSSIPPEILALTNLQSLDLSSNQFSSFPSEICSLTNLQSLYLGGNQLSSLPSEILSLTNLQSLDLSSNQFSSFPPEIRALTNLQSLDLNDNQFSSLPPEIGALTNLQSLYLSDNQFSSLPPEIGALTNLQSLYLSDNQFSSLPPEIGALTNLLSLDLRSNQFSSLPPEIGALTNLQSLDLRGNQLSSLPSEILSLTNLQSLDLRSNQLSSIPKELMKLNLRLHSGESNYLFHSSSNRFIWINHKGINIANNPIEKLLGDIINKSRKEIEILLQKLSTGDKEQNEIKVVLIGEGGSGKTSLVKRLFKEDFDPIEPQTHGIIIKSKELDINDKKVKANFWDFGGQQIMHAAHQFFLSKDTMYILVISPRENDSRTSNLMINKFMKQIETFGGDSKVIVVITKIDRDRASFDLNRSDLKGKYENIVDFRIVSAKDKIGISEFEQRLNLEISNLQTITRRWTENWLEVKKSLEEMEENHIAYTSYQDICNSHKVPTEEQDVLLEYLNNLGIITRFKKFNLKNTNILKPKWVTNAIYRIINSKKLEANHGILNKHEIHEILHSKEECKEMSERDSLLENICYNQEEQQYIVELMKEFHLSYDYQDAKETIMIPSLLNKTEPDFDKSIEKNSLKLKLKYHYLPDSVMPNFIVKINSLIIGDNLWRSGVIFGDDQKWRALVKEDNLEETIYIYISGLLRRDAIPVILDHFNEINKQFDKIRFRTEICIKDDFYYDFNNLMIYLKKGIEEIFIPEFESHFKVREILGEYFININSKEAILIMKNYYISGQGNITQINDQNSGEINFSNSYNESTEIVRLFLEELGKSDVPQEKQKEIITIVEEIEKSEKEKKPKSLIKGMVGAFKEATSLITTTTALGVATTAMIEFLTKLVN